MFKKILFEELTAEQEDHVLKEINYSREQLKLDLQLIKDWLKEQHHLPPCRLKEGDTLLETFLTGCKGSLETVKRKLDHYYTLRSHIELLENLDPLLPSLMASRKICESATMPHATSSGDRVVIVAISCPDIDQFDHMSLARLLANRTFMYLYQSRIGSRLNISIDLKDTNPGFVIKMSPIIVRDFFFILEHALPIRVKKLLVFNVPQIIQIPLNKLLLPFMPAKLRERLEITSEGASILPKHFDPKILPRDYGGVSTNPTLHELDEIWNKFEMDNRSVFINEFTERVDESKRVKTDNSPTGDTYFGVHGSLKKLVID